VLGTNYRTAATGVTKKGYREAFEVLTEVFLKIWLWIWPRFCLTPLEDNTTVRNFANYSPRDSMSHPSAFETLRVNCCMSDKKPARTMRMNEDSSHDETTWCNGQ
jgi:hypothetical protein